MKQNFYQLTESLKKRFVQKEKIELTEEELLTIVNTANSIEKIIVYLEQSEMPFYNGLKILKEL